MEPGIRLGKLGALFLLSVAVAGCLAPPKSGVGPHVSPAAQKKAASAPTEPQLPGKVSGKGWQIRWRRRNPKSPAGAPIPVLFADAKSGALVNDTDTGTARLQQVHARIFQDGKLSADVEAAQVTANQRDGIILGTGGVTIHSMTDPPDTVITSDRMTWDTHTNKLIAEGNANVRHRALDGTVSTSSGGRVIYDTATRTVTIE
jgi:hypothetical protein